MPTKTEQPVAFWFDGVRYQAVMPMETISDIDTPQIGEMSSKSEIHLAEDGACGHISFTISFNRMRRKRAVKLLMANGFQRNTSDFIVRSWGGWYAQRFLWFMMCFADINTSFH